MPGLLHVMNGHSMLPIFHGSGIAGAVTVYADALHEGPVPASLTSGEMRDVRGRFWAGFGPVAVERQTLESKEADPLHEWDAALERHSEYDEVVLWFEHDLFDQLLLIRHLDWFSNHLAPGSTLSLICIDRFPGVERFKGLGELAPQQLPSLVDSRAEVTAAQLSLGRRAWQAFTSSDPHRLQDFLASDTHALPFLAAAIRRWLQEFPSPRTGLPRTEREILEILSARGPLAPVSLFRQTQEREDCYFMGDVSFRARLDTMAASPTPLVTLRLEPSANRILPGGTVEMTDIGRDVLAGRVDWQRSTPLDRWLGGVHLHHGSMWRWDDVTGFAQ